MILVAVKPGTRRKALTLQSGVLRSACCSASVSTLTPALLTLYAASPGGHVMPCFEPVLTTTHGQPCWIIDGTKARPPLMTPHRFVSRILCQRSACMYGEHWPLVCTAALFISRCTAPNLANASHLRATSCSSRRQSQVQQSTSVHLAPAASASRRTPSSSLVSMSASKILIPRRAQRKAVARPMPDAQPTITATEPLASTPVVSTGAHGTEALPRGMLLLKRRLAKA